MRYIKKYEEIDLKKFFGFKKDVDKSKEEPVKNVNDKEVNKSKEEIVKPDLKKKPPKKKKLNDNEIDEYICNLTKSYMDSIGIKYTNSEKNKYIINPNSININHKSFSINHIIFDVDTIRFFNKRDNRADVYFNIILSTNSKLTEDSLSKSSSLCVYKNAIKISLSSYIKLSIVDEDKDKLEISKLFDLPRNINKGIEESKKLIDDNNLKIQFIKDFNDICIDLKDLVVDLQDLVEEYEYKVFESRLVCYFNIKTGLKRSENTYTKFNLNDNLISIFKILSEIKPRVKSIDNEIELRIEFNSDQVIIIFHKPTSVFDDEYNYDSEYDRFNYSDDTVWSHTVARGEYGDEGNEDVDDYDEYN